MLSARQSCSQSKRQEFTFGLFQVPQFDGSAGSTRHDKDLRSIKRHRFNSAAVPRQALHDAPSQEIGYGIQQRCKDDRTQQEPGISELDLVNKKMELQLLRMTKTCRSKIHMHHYTPLAREPLKTL